jgi:hypothetical protein
LKTNAEIMVERLAEDIVIGWLRWAGASNLFIGAHDMMKTNAQLLDEITAAMAAEWLAACERRVIAVAPFEHGGEKVIVWGQQEKAKLFGPASPEECRLFIHRAAALDVLWAIGAGQVAAAARIAADGKLPATLNG